MREKKMNFDGIRANAAQVINNNQYHSLHQSTIERDVEGSAILSPKIKGISYPTPPMSSSPSPDRERRSYSGSSDVREDETNVTSTLRRPMTREPLRHSPIVPMTLSSPSTVFQPTALTTRDYTASIHAAASSSAQRESASSPSTLLQYQAASVSSGVKGARRPKPHVASACINCKKAHLSCDVSRPCVRCIASGKQDTCVDVQHKKRGRPRLREENQFQGQQISTDISVVRTSDQSTVLPALRPTTSSPHPGRSDSIRSSRSLTSEESLVESSASPYHPISSRHGSQSHGSQLAFPGPSPHISPIDVPTAFLNLDLFVVRANNAFEHAVADGHDIRGRHLSDVLMPADTSDFVTIQNHLRQEREMREPVFMPPITLPGQDPIHGIREAEIDALSHGFSDQTYSWRRTWPYSLQERFPARLRLGKANVYFVAVTLPSLVVPPPAHLLSGPTYATGLQLPISGPQRGIRRTTSPARLQVSHIDSTRRSSGPADYQYYTSPQSVSGYSPLASQLPPYRNIHDAITPPRHLNTLPIANTMHLDYTSSRPFQSGLQLPPLQSIAASTSRTSSSQASPQSAAIRPSLSPEQRMTASTQAPRSPKRWKRMDINDVLQD